MYLFPKYEDARKPGKILSELLIMVECQRKLVFSYASSSISIFFSEFEQVSSSMMNSVLKRGLFKRGIFPSSISLWWRTICSYCVSRLDRHVTYYTSHMLYRYICNLPSLKYTVVARLLTCLHLSTSYQQIKSFIISLFRQAEEVYRGFAQRQTSPRIPLRSRPRREHSRWGETISEIYADKRDTDQ
jgi:hypothetical protein